MEGRTSVHCRRSPFLEQKLELTLAITKALAQQKIGGISYEVLIHGQTDKTQAEVITKPLEERSGA